MSEKLITRLSPEQIAFYQKEGYLIYREPVFPAEKFAGLKACFEDILADLPEGFSPENMDVPHFTFPQLYEWLFADEVLALVEPLPGRRHRLILQPFHQQTGLHRQTRALA